MGAAMESGDKDRLSEILYGEFIDTFNAGIEKVTMGNETKAPGVVLSDHADRKARRTRRTASPGNV